MNLINLLVLSLQIRDVDDNNSSQSGQAAGGVHPNIGPVGGAVGGVVGAAVPTIHQASGQVPVHTFRFDLKQQASQPPKQPFISHSAR